MTVSAARFLALKIKRHPFYNPWRSVALDDPSQPIGSVPLLFCFHEAFRKVQEKCERSVKEV